MVSNSVANQDNTFYALKCKPGMFYIQPICGPVFGKKICLARLEAYFLWLII